MVDKSFMKMLKQKVERAVEEGKLPRELLLYEEVERRDRKGRPKPRRRHLDSLCDGAVRGGDLEYFKNNVDAWIDWLSWSSVVLDEEDYFTVAVHALDLAPRLAGTDYGTSRMRDLGQLWTDTIRGFLGELAFVKWLKEKFRVEAELDYRKGPLEQFLPSDLKSVGGRAPKLRLSIKSTKLRSVWLDIPYEQVRHSDVFVLVRVGVTRMHFLAFLKKISVIREKMLERAIELGIISEEEARSIWEVVPEFENIPSYIVGFLDKREYGRTLDEDPSLILHVDGEMKRKNFVINRFVGFWHPRKKEYREKVIQLLQSKGMRSGAELKFEGIDNFTPTLHFIVHSGFLKRTKDDWSMLVQSL